MKKYLTCISIIILFLALCYVAFWYLQNRIKLDESKMTSNETAEFFLPEQGSKNKSLPERNEFTLKSPILMYHYIQEWDGLSELVRGLTVSPSIFESQLSGLENLGYSFISLEDLQNALEHKEELDKKIVLTFDDGYEDFYTFAYPILKEKHIPATVFVITNYIGKPGYLNWAQINELSDSEIITIGSHNMSHISLPKVEAGKAEYEIFESRKVLEAGLGKQVKYFCYPNGDFNSEVADFVKNSGYDLAVSTIQDVKQTLTDEYWLPRIRIGSSYSAQTIDYKIKGFEK